MALPQFKLLRPRNVEDAVGFLHRYEKDGVQICAGGTDIIPSMKQKLFTPAYLMDIRAIDDLQRIRVVSGLGVEIGALVTLSAIEDSGFIASHYSVLREAVMTVASPLLRNMGTIGGNICLDTRCLWYNQSLQWRKSCGFCIKKDGDLCHVAPGGKFCWAAFSADSPAALLCLNAEIEIASPAGSRRISLADFYTNVGDDRIKLAKNELLTRVFLPEAMADMVGVYKKLRIRGSIDYPLAGVAVALRKKGKLIEDARVAITGVNPAPHLVKDALHALIGKEINDVAAAAVGELAARIAKPLTTSLLTPEYRREMIRVYAKRAVLAAAAN
jgi:4-hydroxybenzoyl-CoA reductase subunit beta